MLDLVFWKVQWCYWLHYFISSVSSACTISESTSLCACICCIFHACTHPFLFWIPRKWLCCSVLVLCPLAWLLCPRALGSPWCSGPDEPNGGSPGLSRWSLRLMRAKSGLLTFYVTWCVWNREFIGAVGVIVCGCDVCHKWYWKSKSIHLGQSKFQTFFSINLNNGFSLYILEGPDLFQY